MSPAEPTPLFALAGGAFIFLAFLIVMLAAVVFAYYSKTGSEITQRPLGDRGDQDSSVFGDRSQSVHDWSRGTGVKRHQRNRSQPRTPEELAQALDPETRERLRAWRERLSQGGLTPALAKDVDQARDHVRGSADADVTIVAYGDFQCPSCQAADWEVRALQKEMGEDRLRYAFRHFPLADVHEGAVDAAQAVELAATHGKFWDMHDVIYRSARPPTRETLAISAGKVGITGEELDRALEERPYTERIAEDFDTGVRSGVDGTPTLFINGTRHDADMDRDTLRTAIEAQAHAAAS